MYVQRNHFFTFINISRPQKNYEHLQRSKPAASVRAPAVTHIFYLSRQLIKENLRRSGIHEGQNRRLCEGTNPRISRYDPDVGIPYTLITFSGQVSPCAQGVRNERLDNTNLAVNYAR